MKEEDIHSASFSGYIRSYISGSGSTTVLWNMCACSVYRQVIVLHTFAVTYTVRKYTHTLTVFFSFCGGFPREGRLGVSSFLGAGSGALNQRFFSYLSLINSTKAWSSLASGILSVLSFQRANHFALATWRQRAMGEVQNQKSIDLASLFHLLLT